MIINKLLYAIGYYSDFYFGTQTVKMIHTISRYSKESLSLMPEMSHVSNFG